MKAFHQDAQTYGTAPGYLNLGTTAAKHGVAWPALPWTCPRCTRKFRNHADTIATFEPFQGEAATFLCSTCEIAVNVIGANMDPS